MSKGWIIRPDTIASDIIILLRTAFYWIARIFDAEGRLPMQEVGHDSRKNRTIFYQEK